ncbi:hypothetical protein AB0D57_44375 [Streptomyces sp. NPDC048275]|uniref:hypothetical protein n=1 Tax=Streptomyces sp. NPDC048275 TaxID=3155629 RepID=UPI0033D679B0
MTQVQHTEAPAGPFFRSGRLPLAGLLALAAGGFVTIMLETMPAGIRPAISGGLGVSEASAAARR